MMRAIRRSGVLAAALGLFGCARAAAPPVEPAPAPAHAPAPPPAEAPPAGRPVALCILRDGDVGPGVRNGRVVHMEAHRVMRELSI